MVIPRAAIAALALSLLAATPERVVVIADLDGAKPYEEAIAAMRGSGARVERIAEADPSLPGRLMGEDRQDVLWIAMGPKSARRLVGAQGDLRRAALFVRAGEAPAGLPTVRIDVPLDVQLGWVKRAFPGRRRILVLRGSRSLAAGSAEDEALERACKALELELAWIDVRSPGESVPALREALRQRARTAVLWLSPDPVAVTPDTVAPLIQEALAARVPAVGFSSYFLRVGAIGAVVSDYGAAGRQALRLARTSSPTASSVAGSTLVSSPVEAPERSRLQLDRRLAERLGIALGSGDGIEVLP